MLSRLVVGKVSEEEFTQKLNQALEELQNKDHEIIDVQYAQSMTKASALILYK